MTSPESSEESKQSEPPPSPGESPGSEDTPSIEDAYAPPPPVQQEVVEDDLDLLDPATRSLEASDADGEEAAADAADAAAEVIEADESGDADKIPDEPGAAVESAQPLAETRLDHDVVAHRIAVKLKRVETQVRELLEGRDPKRKRKLSGTRRWHELEDDIIEWRFTGRIDEASLIKLTELVARRNYLFRSLRFVSGTRPRWNT